IGIADRLFSRVGASDDLARGQSTFMVEMVETAAILNQATRKSLVILDEIGRGTATYDGLAIACATLEWLHNENGCRTLFATHYHELTAMQSSLQRLRTHTMLVREWDGQIVFLHQLGPGVADRSYGVHVARLAGLPEQVIARASQLLELLEAGKQDQLEMADLAASLPLFQAAPPAAAKAEPAEPDALDVLLDDLDPDALSPKQALDLLYQIKQARMARKNS
ncbi:MAG: DNA mismatch repair protein MutS, partial [Alphaproteobacteria bacterium]|nr:DNA mismatch repair protein MutS [Alphaproteobacteria bacterium]